MRLIPLVLLALLLVSCKSRKKTVPFNGENAVAVAAVAPIYTDPYYQLQVAELPPQWKLMDRTEIKSILPDGVVGGLRVNGLYTAILVEPMKEVGAGQYAALIAGNMSQTVGSGEVPEISKTTFSGQEARHFTIDGILGGIPFHYECLTLVYKGFGYQLLTWYTSADLKGQQAHVTEFIDSVTLLDGQPTLPPLEAHPDVEVIGSRLKDGIFASSVFRFEAHPNENWQALLGTPLTEIAPDAEVALTEPRRGIYLTVTASHLANRDPQALQRLLKNNIADLVEAEPLATLLKPLPFQIGRDEVPFARYDMDGDVPSRHYSALYCRGGIAFDLEAWHLKLEDAEVLNALQEALRALKFLSEEEAAALAAELGGKTELQSGVGAAHSLRNGIFRSFENGYQWKKPAGMWRIEIGDAAMARNADSDLFTRNIENDLYLQIIAEEAPGYTSSAYHQLVVEILTEGEPAPQVTRLPDHELDSVTFQQTRLVLGPEGDQTAFHLCTATSHGRAFQLFFWATPESLRQSTEQIREAMTGFSLPSSPLQATERSARSYRDHRVGWEFRYPDAGWSPRRMPMAYDAIGSAVQFRQGSNVMQVMGIHLEVGADQTQFAETMVSQLLEVNLDRASAAGATKNTGTFAGQSATLIKGRSEGNAFRVATFSSGGTLWILMAAAGNDREADSLFTDFEKGFRILP